METFTTTTREVETVESFSYNVREYSTRRKQCPFRYLVMMIRTETGTKGMINFAAISIRQEISQICSIWNDN